MRVRRVAGVGTAQQRDAPLDDEAGAGERNQRPDPIDRLRGQLGWRGCADDGQVISSSFSRTA
jgi:hypothetical protein